MKFLCDVHISLKISKLLEDKGAVSIHVNSILDKWHTSDKDIINYADSNDLIVLTKDQDFKHSFLLKRKPKKLIKIGLGNISNVELWKILDTFLKRIEGLYDSEDSFMVEINQYSMKPQIVVNKP